MRTWLIAGAAALVAGAGGMAISGFAASGAGEASGHGGKHHPPIRCVDGASEVGDTYYAGIGNGGYDVAHYDLDLDYDPATRLLDGVATISASATQSLCRFNLDLRGLSVSSVRVDHSRAGWRREGRELIITPRRPLPAGEGFTVEVRYSGEPGPAPTDPSGFLDGWNYTDDGSYTSTPPQGADTWYPNNNTTNDKATFRFEVTVPDDIQAIANGQLISKRVDHRRGTSTWVWDETEQMATYLATLSTGKFTILRDETADGLPIINAVQPDQLTEQSRADLDTIEPILDFFGERFGPYPFSSTGAIVDVTDAGYQMETQTRPEFTSARGLRALAHELAHQWFGDDVAVRRMRDVWLSEGFATYADWLWDEHTGEATAQSRFDTQYARGAGESFWTNTVFDPGVENQYQGPTVYTRGAMTLHALRVKVGDEAFFRTLKAYVKTFSGVVASTQDFVSIAERESGMRLDRFFDVWLYEEGKPTNW
jgi:aminopeptidase N